MVTGETTSIGRINIPITINSITHIVDLHVVKGFNHNLLIGLDAGKLFNLNISLGDKTVTVNHQTTFSAHITDHQVGPLAPEPNRLKGSSSVRGVCFDDPLIQSGPSRDPLSSSSFPNSSIEQILHQFSDIFATDKVPVGSIPNVQHTITTSTETPIYVKPYRKPQTEHDDTRVIVKDLLRLNYIRSSNSPYGFPSTLAKKKNGEPRLCIDYRALNKVTVSDKYSIPQIQDVLDRLQGSKFFSTLDMAWGYWHVKMDPRSIPKTAFITQDGHFEWLVMPFGLKNAPSTLQRALRTILGDLAYKCTINYLDDIIVYSRTEEEHKQHLQEVLSKLRANNIKLRMKKCSFMTQKVEFLGFQIHQDSVSPNPEKVKALQEYSPPRTRKQVQRFLGLCSYFRSLIPKYTESAFPLTQLTRKSVNFRWSEKEKASFDSLRKALQGPPILKIFDPSLLSELHTDASKVGIGAILVQRNPDGTPRVISYFSKRLSKEQENWSTTDQEGLAVVEGIEKFDCYLRPFKFSVFTDNSSLTWICNSSKLKGRLLRWFLRLQPYSFDIFHRKGSQNQHVDALSRAPVNPPSNSEAIPTKGIINDYRKMGHEGSKEGPNQGPANGSIEDPATSTQAPTEVNSLSSSQPMSSTFLDQIADIFEGPPHGQNETPSPRVWTHVASTRGWNPNHSLPFSEEVLRQAQESSDLSHIRRQVVTNGIIHIRDRRRNKRKVVPQMLVKTVLRFYHENHGHFSKEKTSRMINRYYWWPSIGKDITAHIDSCHECQLFKAPKGPPPGELQLMPTPNKPFHIMSLDTVIMQSEAHNTSYKNIQVLIDHHSRFVWTLASKKNDAQSAINIMNKVLEFNPKVLITDNGPNFTSKAFESYLSKHKIKHIKTTAYHPSSNGMVERVNQTLKDRMKFLSHQHPKFIWTSLLKDATGIYNATLHDVTGFTPRFLLTGDEEVPDVALVWPLEKAREQAAINTAKAQRRRKELYDRNHVFVEFEPGDKVRRRIPKNHPDFQNKLAPKHLGPLTVIRKTGPVNYLIGESLEDPKPIHVHLDQILPYYDRVELADVSLSHGRGGCDGPEGPQGCDPPQALPSIVDSEPLQRPFITLSL